MELNFRTLRPTEIDCRVSRVVQSGVVLLLYKDARVDMTLLDETVGPMNWQRFHSRENANCTVSIYDSEKGEWVSKEDTGTESNTEAAKGLASDSFKRACVNWGIGRELYTAPFIFVKADYCKIEPGKNGKLACNDKFSVTDIQYNDAREISGLTIVNTKTNRIVYKMGAQPAREAEHHICDNCGGEILGGKYRGEVCSPAQFAEITTKTFGVPLCSACAMNYGQQGA